MNKSAIDCRFAKEVLRIEEDVEKENIHQTIGQPVAGACRV
jgi:hypothetical protein